MKTTITIKLSIREYRSTKLLEKYIQRSKERLVKDAYLGYLSRMSPKL